MLRYLANLKKKKKKFIPFRKYKGKGFFKLTKIEKKKNKMQSLEK